MSRKVSIMIVSAAILAAQTARGIGPVNSVRPKTGGTENDPLIQLELSSLACDNWAETLLAALNQLSWTSRTAVLPCYPGTIAKERLRPKASAVVAVGERKWADITELVRRLRAAQFKVSAIHLSGFGTVRLRTQFSLEKPTKEDQQRIEAVYRSVPWLRDAKFTPAGAKPDFNLSKSPEVRAEFVLRDSQVIEIGALVDRLSAAGYHPKVMRVARMFAGVPFGFPIPGDVVLADSAGIQLLSGQLRKPNRPLVLVFFSLSCKYKQGKEEKTHHAQPRHFARLKEVALEFADRADFVGISSSKRDSPAGVAELWRKAALPFRVFRDPDQKFAQALSAGLSHPPPHIFILDNAGKLRYAGEFADGWVEPEKIKRLHLVEALERVLANKVADNGAVFNQSPPCACSAVGCQCPKCGCGGPCRCACSTGGG